jgi:hypothetical protein
VSDLMRDAEATPYFREERIYFNDGLVSFEE